MLPLLPQKAFRAIRGGGASLLLAKGAEHLRTQRRVSAAIPAFTVGTRRLRSLEDSLRFAYEFRAGGLEIAPQQIRGEVTRLLEQLASHRPSVVLEIGTAGGGTLFLFTRVASPGARLVTVDLDYPTPRARLYRRFAQGGQVVKPLLGDSHRLATKQRVDRALRGRPVDFLFIDGDHSASGVRSDFDMYAPLVRKGGLIGLHDIVPGPEAHVGGVPEFWRELKDSFATEELVESWQQGGFGIGLLHV